MEFDNPLLYENRELSWLEFNKRVLEEAQDENNPILERLKFLSISGSNLDEFFMIRVAGLKEQVEVGFEGKDPSGLTPKEQLFEISKVVHAMVKEQYRTLNKSLLPSLDKNGMKFLLPDELSKKEYEFLEDFFKYTIYPVLTPMAIDQSRPFPLLPNKSLNQAILLKGEEGQDLFAMVQVPAVLPRFIKLPSKGTQTFILLGQIIKMFVHQLFPGYEVSSIHPFRITRNADLSIDEEEAQDLLVEIEKSLQQRKRGFPVRLEIEKNSAKEVKDLLIRMLELSEEDIYDINGPIDLSSWMKIASIDGYENLKFTQFKPFPSRDFFGQESFFKVIQQKDIIIHHPYQSFEHVVDFLREAAEDPRVLAIKQTLYRVSDNSPIIDELIKAAENGKQVTVLVELKARFDEDNNIQLAKKLEKAGCYVVYGLVGLKTHSKILLIVRQETTGIRRYVHVSTGNYHNDTAKVYTDLGFFTCKDSFGSDASSLFNLLTGYSQPPEWKEFAVAPLKMRETFFDWIDNEITNFKAGFEARIIIKLNSLLDKPLIQKLYLASKGGVKIDLIVRGICALKPGIPDVSENIKVISIVGRFLEHSRIFYFQNNGNPKVFLSSADWMPRNLDRRIEILFPLEDESIINDLLSILELNLEDTAKSRIKKPDGNYLKLERKSKKNFNSQEELIERYRALFSVENLKKESEFLPVTKREPVEK